MLQIERLRTETYQDWPLQRLVDVRSGTQAQYEMGFTKIIEAEGPMVCYRAYQLFAKASEVGKITAPTKARLDRALQVMIDKGELIAEVETDEGDEDLSKQIIRLKDQPIVRLRSRGSRSIDEIPPSELAEVILHFSSQDEWLGKEDVFRLVLEHYELQKLTALGRRCLENAMQRYF